MVTVLIILGAAIVILVALALMTKSRWTTLEQARGNNSDEIQTKYSYLQSKHIPSRLKTESPGPASGIASGGMGFGTVGDTVGFRNELVKLQVRPSDRARAEEALQELAKEQLLHQGTSL
ncbi:hypothetical protein EBB07_03705 [Paenibacillaceae bacterium]|nr:hypothetical protein EBB07_03705 [Paenibacillaceae bacterium]